MNVEVAIICAWCLRVLGTKKVEVGGQPPEDAPRVTHDICDGCQDEMMSQVNGLKETRGLTGEED